MQCVVLAGGLGTRLRPFTDHHAKSMVPVAGRPFVDWQLELLRDRGVREVVLCLGVHAGEVRAHVGDGGPLGPAVRYVEDGPEPLGTGGALARAREAGVLAPEFTVTYGDSYLTADHGPVLAALGDPAVGAVMTLVSDDGGPVAGNAAFDGRRVTAYRKGGERLPFIDYGLTAMRREVVADLVDPAGPSDLGELFARLAAADRLLGLEVAERFHEVGTWAGVAELERYLAALGALDRTEEEVG